jgi:WD40 repeat protein
VGNDSETNARQKTQEAKEAQQKGDAASQSFWTVQKQLTGVQGSLGSNELFITGQEFKGLLKGLELGNKLKQRPQYARAVDNTQMVTTLGLQQAVYGVQERDSLKKYQSAVRSVSFSPDGKTLASGSWDKTVKLWDVASGQEIKTLSGHQDAVTSVSFSLAHAYLCLLSMKGVNSLNDFT